MNSFAGLRCVVAALREADLFLRAFHATTQRRYVGRDEMLHLTALAGMNYKVGGFLCTRLGAVKVRD
jgi:hypothetical protein